MILQRHSFTYITLALFIFALYENNLLAWDRPVSGESGSAVEQTAVKEGLRSGGRISLSAIPEAPNTPPSMKFGNHSRTLRAFLAPARSGALAVFVESISPHAYYIVSGDYTVSREYPTLWWTGASTLEFYGRTGDGRLSEIQIDVRKLFASIQPIESVTQELVAPQ